VDTEVFFILEELDDRLRDAKIDVIGAESSWAWEAAERTGVVDAVTFHGFKPYGEALSMVSAADAGLLHQRAFARSLHRRVCHP
jgi:ABC-type sugar transport system substrate-binding protein